MSRLFWKLFLALWLSIMAFSAVMAWVNASLVGAEPPGTEGALFRRAVEQVEDRLARALEADDPLRARILVRQLPRHIRNHVLVVRDGRELLGRDFMLERLEERGIERRNRRVVSASGRVYELMMLERRPPGALLAPGWRGVLHRLMMAALVSAFVSWLLARYLTRPLEHIGRVGRRLAAGDLAARVGEPLHGRRDEFGQLARNLDDMAGRLEELQAANQRLLRDVSHELRSPLARMRVALEIARNRDGGRVDRELDRIELEGDRLETLVDEVLSLLRESSGTAPLHAERFDLAEFLSDLRDTVNYESPEGSAGVALEAMEPLFVVADRELLWRAVENLLRNALTHTDAAKGVQLSAARHADGEIGICVADHGPGLPEAQLARIFEPFYRAQEARDRKTGGHGLGLTIAAAAVRRHRGRINVRNRPGGGLEFCIRLPAESAA